MMTVRAVAAALGGRAALPAQAADVGS